MALLQPYQGTYVSAGSASSSIDAESIIAGCDAVDVEADRLVTSTNNIVTASSPLNEDNLSVNGNTVQDNVDNCCTSINDIKTGILNMTSQIRDMAELQYNQIQEQLNYEAQAKDQSEINRRSRG